jgi:hypothetical protein
MAIGLAIYDNTRGRGTGRKKLGAGSCLFLLVLVFVLCTPTPIKAGTTIFSDLGPGGAYNPSGPGGPWCVTGANSPSCGPETLRKVASPFTPSANYNLTQVDMALQFFGGTNEVLVTLETDSGGAPSGTALASWSLSNIPAYTGSACCALQTQTFSAPLTGARRNPWKLLISDSESTTWLCVSGKWLVESACATSAGRV